MEVIVVGGAVAGLLQDALGAPHQVEGLAPGAGVLDEQRLDVADDEDPLDLGAGGGGAPPRPPPPPPRLR
jgi:hypothetical protein